MVVMVSMSLMEVTQKNDARDNATTKVTYYFVYTYIVRSWTEYENFENHFIYNENFDFVIWLIVSNWQDI